MCPPNSCIGSRVRNRMDFDSQGTFGKWLTVRWELCPYKRTPEEILLLFPPWGRSICAPGNRPSLDTSPWSKTSTLQSLAESLCCSESICCYDLPSVWHFVTAVQVVKGTGQLYSESSLVVISSTPTPSPTPLFPCWRACMCMHSIPPGNALWKMVFCNTGRDLVSSSGLRSACIPPFPTSFMVLCPVCRTDVLWMKIGDFFPVLFLSHYK